MILVQWIVPGVRIAQVLGMGLILLCGCNQIQPQNLKEREIQIAYFGPSHPDHPVASGMWQAAEMALEQANRRGGFNGRTLRLIPCWADDPWSGGVNAVARAVFEDKVCAVIGGIDGPTTHLAEQIIVKEHLAMINPSSTDKTVNLAFVPWMFSCLPDDEAQSRILADAIVNRIGPEGRFAVLSADDHDSHLFTVELLKALSAHRKSPSRHIQVNSRDPDMASLDQGMNVSEALLLIAGPETSAKLLIAMRAKGLSAPVFGGPWMGQNLFRQLAGSAAEGVVFPLLWLPSPIADRFIEDFRHRTGYAPDYLAAQMYDAVLLVAEAIQKSGPDRSVLIDSIRDRSPRQGVAGMVQWDSLGRNRRPVGLGTIQNGQIGPLSK